MEPAWIGLLLLISVPLGPCLKLLVSVARKTLIELWFCSLSSTRALST